MCNNRIKFLQTHNYCLEHDRKNIWDLRYLVKHALNLFRCISKQILRTTLQTEVSLVFLVFRDIGEQYIVAHGRILLNFKAAANIWLEDPESRCFAP